MASDRPSIVVIGGGTGCPAVLRSLLPYPVRLSAIVTTFDNGGSTGRLRAEMGLPALGDLRRALGALSGPKAPSSALRELLEHRFSGRGALAGHSVGNLLLAALCERAGGLSGGIREAERLLEARGRVVPVSLEFAHLGAELADGTRLLGEEKIDHLPQGSPAIARVFLEPPVGANPDAVDLLTSADLIVLGPGDLYTSLLPNLLVPEIARSVRESQGARVFICNLTNRPGQTGGFAVSSYLRETLRYLSMASLDAVVANGGSLPQGSEPVRLDTAECRGLVREVLSAPLASPDGHRHAERMLGEAVWGLWLRLSRQDSA